MIVGIISDIHDRLPHLKEAIRRLNSENVEIVLSAGDYVAPFVTPLFEPLNAKMIGVFGNNDAERYLLKERFSKLGFDVEGTFKKLDIDGLRVALFHGAERELLNAVVELSNFDVVIHGHTHEAEIKRENGMLIINPGEVCGYLSGRSTIAVLDTKEKREEIITL